MYTDAKYLEGVVRPVKYDDFMPLANDEHVRQRSGRVKPTSLAL